MTVVKLVTTTLILVAVCSSSATQIHPKMERIIAFAVQQEIYANRLEIRKDVCIGIGHGLVANESDIIAELNARGLKLHSNQWCNEGPRGFVISVIPPINTSQPNVYEIVLELADLRPISDKGEHFGKLVKRGSYSIKLSDNAETDLLSYRKICCPQ